MTKTLTVLTGKNVEITTAVLEELKQSKGIGNETVLAVDQVLRLIAYRFGHVETDNVPRVEGYKMDSPSLS